MIGPKVYSTLLPLLIWDTGRFPELFACKGSAMPNYLCLVNLQLNDGDWGPSYFPTSLHLTLEDIIEDCKVPK